MSEKKQETEEKTKEKTRKMLTKYGCWEPLWRHQDLPMDTSQEEKLPFWADRKMIGVYE